ncbi:hypothetical protein Dsin_015076 [Dipteronia sinensis]|uniref:Uncharacterized protein n=1 Tax=Dipteronia sinensis TaxID=43782 RepID=A0AAE0EAH5_9ROSI|nr:hypothetical protein Dsin_015076 [Dipteronia sinensis]
MPVVDVHFSCPIDFAVEVVSNEKIHEMGKIVKLFGLASAQSATAVEGHAGEGTVCDVQVGQNEGPRAHAMVEFTTIEAGELIKSLAFSGIRILI